MRPLVVVELEIFFQALFCIIYSVVGVEINFFIFDTAPESFNKDVITPAAFSVHADLDVVIFQHVGKFQAGDLAALVGVEDFRPAITIDSPLYRLDAKFFSQRVRQSPRQYLSTRLVDRNKQEEKAMPHRNIDDICRTDAV